MQLLNHEIEPIIATALLFWIAVFKFSLFKIASFIPLIQIEIGVRLVIKKKF